MAFNFLTHIFGSRNDRLLKLYRKTVVQINALEAALEKLDDAALQAKTEEFKTRFQNGESLDSLLLVRIKWLYSSKRANSSTIAENSSSGI